MAYRVVARTDEIPPGGRRLVEANGRRIVVFNVDGEYFALLDRCPHQGASLCKGVLSVATTSREPGEYEYDPGRTVIRCPWHAWEFDVRTGRSWCEPDRIRVRRYETEVVEASRLVEGPYAAERFPVRAEGRYILVDA